MMMKGILVENIGSFKWTSVPVKAPGADEVLVKVEVTGLCRTDLKLIRAGHRDLLLPRIPGEEVVGKVAAKGAAVEGLWEGDRVYVYPGIWCGACPPCRMGAENLCRGMRIMGFHRDGGFAEYVTVPARSVIRVPEGLPPDHAVFAEPLSCCLNALELGEVAAGKRVGIWGAGPAGTLLSRAARALGAVPVNMEPDPRRRERIGGYEVPPDTAFDLCVVAVGDREAYREALARLAPRGVLVVFSGLTPAGDEIGVSFNQLHYHEQKLAGAYGCSFRHGVRALELIAQGKVAVGDMISHRLYLEHLDKGLTIVENKSGMKVLLYP